MGTRNLTIVVKGGEVKVAQYGQWDGYPSNNGKIILSFIKSKKFNAFKKYVDNLTWINENEQKGQWASVKENADEFKRQYPESSRDTGSGILAVIHAKKGKVGLVNQIDFAADSLFCKWAYVINLDKNQLEVYRGFNKKPLKKGERFKGLSKKIEYRGQTNSYYPIKLKGCYLFNNLPDEKTFIAEMEKED